MFDDIWDAICDFFGYLFSFEWVGDIGELFSSMFENISEFSVVGTILGLLGVGLIFLLREQMLSPFLLHMGRFEAMFWGTATYLGTFIAGYLLGKHFENT